MMDTRSSSGTVEAWCQPMDAGRHTPRQFLLYFDDPDHGNAVFDNEADARKAFEQATVTWNCYLFGAMPLGLAQADPVTTNALEYPFAQFSITSAHPTQGRDKGDAVAWGRVIDGRAVTVSLERTGANNEPLYAAPQTTTAAPQIRSAVSSEDRA